MAVDELIVPTPQRLHPTKRRLYGRHRRARFIARQVTAHTEALQAHLLAGGVVPNSWDVLASAETQLGLPYSISGCRCSPNPCWARDCSGLICFALNVRGYPSICTSSFGFAQLARDHGLIIPKAQALWTPGAIGIRCPFCNPNSNGSNGHIWFCKGDGVHSVEEGGHATGCYEGLADKAGDVIYALIPGVNYVKPVVTIPKERGMVIQKVHYNPDGTTRPIPLRNEDGTFKVARIFVSADGKHLDERGGASLAHDVERTANYRTWTPPTDDPEAPFDPKHDVILAVDEWSSGEPGSIPGVFAQYSNGYGRAIRFS